MEPSFSTESVETIRMSFFHPVKSRSFTALWLGQTFSQFGDAILWVALPLTVYSMGRSTLQMGVVMALLMLPQVLLLPFTGILVDRVSRSRLMMLTDIIRCLLVVGLAVLVGTHRLTMPFLDAFVLLFGAMDALFQPAYSAARAQVFTPDIRNAANGLTQVSQQVARLLGPTIGGVVVGFATVAAGFAVDAVTLLTVSVRLPDYYRRPRAVCVVSHTSSPGGIGNCASIRGCGLPSSPSRLSTLPAPASPPFCCPG
jgi:MFS family permease